MSKYTPSPWTPFKYPDVKSWTVTARESVASKINSEADAHLIAASPDLLLALQELESEISVNYMPFCDEKGPAYRDLKAMTEKAQAAIRKARGGDYDCCSKCKSPDCQCLDRDGDS